MTVDIKNVGRSKACWQIQVSDDADDGAISEAVCESIDKRTPRPLMSRFIDAAFNPEINDGVIFAGLHVVGSFSIVKSVEP